MAKPVTATEVLAQFHMAGLLPFCQAVDVSATAITGTADLAILERLRSDPRFACGVLHGLHADVGEDRIEFRSYNGEFGTGSLQVVIDRTTGRFHADVDRFSPYNDVVRFLGHAGEVIGSWFRRLFS